MASTQEVEVLRRQLDELTAQMIELRQQSSSTAMNAAVKGPTEAVRTMGPHSTDTRVRSILPILPCGKQRDNHQQW